MGAGKKKKYGLWRLLGLLPTAVVVAGLSLSFATRYIQPSILFFSLVGRPWLLGMAAFGRHLGGAVRTLVAETLCLAVDLPIAEL